MGKCLQLLRLRSITPPLVVALLASFGAIALRKHSLVHSLIELNDPMLRLSLELSALSQDKQ